MFKLLVIAAFFAHSHAFSLRFKRGEGSTSDSVGMSRVAVIAPTECTKNGKIYQEGQIFGESFLRYKCLQHGQIDIIGCNTERGGAGKFLKLGETHVENNLATRCYQDGSQTKFVQFSCGISGTPDCDKLDPIPTSSSGVPSSSSSGTGSRTITVPSGVPVVSGNLPAGWKIVDANGNPVPVSSGSQTRTVVTSGTGSMMPTLVSGTGTSSVVGRGIGASPRSGGTGTGTSGQWETAGSSSSVVWSGQEKNIGGRQIAVGPGTFVVRSGPTGTSVSQTSG